jgi:hypothetical protein
MLVTLAMVRGHHQPVGQEPLAGCDQADDRPRHRLAGSDPPQLLGLQSSSVAAVAASLRLPSQVSSGSSLMGTPWAPAGPGKANTASAAHRAAPPRLKGKRARAPTRRGKYFFAERFMNFPPG